MGKLPTIVRDTEEHYSINESRRMVGKTVQRVDFGTLKTTSARHQSEVLLIEFTDGEILEIDTGSNVADPQFESKIKPDDIRIDLSLTWHNVQ